MSVPDDLTILKVSERILLGALEQEKPESTLQELTEYQRKEEEAKKQLEENKAKLAEASKILTESSTPANHQLILLDGQYFKTLNETVLKMMDSYSYLVESNLAKMDVLKRGSDALLQTMSEQNSRELAAIKSSLEGQAQSLLEIMKTVKSNAEQEKRVLDRIESQ